MSVNVAVICCLVTFFKQHSARAGTAEKHRTQYDVIDIMKYDITKYDVMKYDIMKYVVMTYDIMTFG